jgi:DNA-directed RNA polymerase specialized sigma24 family protein
MEYEEIAVALDCSVGTARQHFHLAVRAVRDALAGERDD